MKLLIVNGSPRKNGVTAKMINALCSEIDWEVEIYNAYEMDIKPCIGCGYCSKNIGCIFDDMDDFKRDFENCDAFLLASPVYFSSFPAPLKAVIDRLQSYYAMRFDFNIKPPVKKFRPSAVLITAGADNQKEIEFMKNQIRQCFSILNTEIKTEFVITDTDKKIPEKDVIDKFISEIKNFIV